MGVDLQTSGNQWRIENANENAVWVVVAQPSYNQHLLFKSHQVFTVGQNEAIYMWVCWARIEIPIIRGRTSAEDNEPTYKAAGTDAFCGYLFK